MGGRNGPNGLAWLAGREVAASMSSQDAVVSLHPSMPCHAMPLPIHQHHHPLLKDPARHGCRVHWGLHWRESPTTRTRAWNPSRRTGGKEKKRNSSRGREGNRAGCHSLTLRSLPSVKHPICRAYRQRASPAGLSTEATQTPSVRRLRQGGTPGRWTCQFIVTVRACVPDTSTGPAHFCIWDGQDRQTGRAE